MALLHGRSSGRKPLYALPIEGLDTCDDVGEECGEPVDDLIPMPLGDGNKEHVVEIRSNLDKITKQHLVTFLQGNADVFAWSPADLLGISLEAMTHHLGIDPIH